MRGPLVNCRESSLSVSRTVVSHAVRNTVFGVGNITVHISRSNSPKTSTQWTTLFVSSLNSMSTSPVCIKCLTKPCMHYRIQFKIATLTYKTLATCQPSYLYNLLQLHQPSRALRSSTQQLLLVPYMSTDFGRCAFSYSSPATWNSIPTSIKNCPFLYSFKCHLKSHLIDQLINN